MYSTMIAPIEPSRFRLVSASDTFIMLPTNPLFCSWPVPTASRVPGPTASGLAARRFLLHLCSVCLIWSGVMDPHCLMSQSRNRSLSSLPHCLVISSINRLSQHGAGSSSLGDSTVVEEAPQPILGDAQTD